jgi:hypothetical protein
MPLPTIFATLSNATGAQLDGNFSALGALTIVSGILAGTNTLVLTPGATTPTVAAYANYMAFSGIAAASNTAAVTLAVGSLAALAVYRDGPTGPVALVGGEIAIGNWFLAVYDSALNSGAGGFHLVYPTPLPQSSTATVNNNAGVTLTAAQATGAGTAFGVINRTGAPGGGISDQLPTAATIIAALNNAGANVRFSLLFSNATGQTITMTTNTGLTLAGTMTTAAGTTHTFIGVVTGAGAVTVYG